MPQMGWNELEAVGESPLLAGVPNGAYAYFVHSYAAPPGPYTRAVDDLRRAVLGRRSSKATSSARSFTPSARRAAAAQILDNFLKINL